MDEGRGARDLTKPVWLERPLTDKQGGRYAFEYAAFPDADAPAGQDPRDDQTPRPIFDLARRLNAAFTPTRTLDHRLVRTFDATTSRGTGCHPLLDDTLQLGPNQHVFLLALKPDVADALPADLAPR